MIKSSEQFNEQHPIGTPVNYYPVIGVPNCTPTKTRSKAWTMYSGEHVVMIEGKSGCVSLQAIEVKEIASTKGEVSE